MRGLLSVVHCLDRASSSRPCTSQPDPGWSRSHASRSGERGRDPSPLIEGSPWTLRGIDPRGLKKYDPRYAQHVVIPMRVRRYKNSLRRRLVRWGLPGPLHQELFQYVGWATPFTRQCFSLTPTVWSSYPARSQHATGIPAGGGHSLRLEGGSGLARATRTAAPLEKYFDEMWPRGSQRYQKLLRQLPGIIHRHSRHAHPVAYLDPIDNWICKISEGKGVSAW